MTGPVSTSVPMDWDDVVADLRRETSSFAERQRCPEVTTPGAIGLLNPATRASVWVYSPADLAAVLDEVEVCRVVPDLHLAAHLQPDLELLDARGWRQEATFSRMRRSLLDWVPPASALAGRPALLSDLPALRRLQDECFGTDEGDLFLPDGLLSIPGVHLRMLEGPDGAPTAVCGVRLRYEGVLVFGLASAVHVRGRGSATDLLRACLSVGAAEGGRFAVADVDTPVPPLWSREGFVVTDSWVRYLPPGS